MTSRLVERYKYLKERAFEDDQALREFDSLGHVFECGGIEHYRIAMEHAKKIGARRVFDVGCAYGHQSEVFVDSGVDYVGINNHDLVEFWNRDRYEYLVGEYPMDIKTSKSDMAVSVLCLTWNCYLFDGIETLKAQCEALARDFNHVLLYMPRESVGFVAKHFDGHENLGRNFVYFYKQ